MRGEQSLLYYLLYYLICGAMAIIWYLLGITVFNRRFRIRDCLISMAIVATLTASRFLLFDPNSVIGFAMQLLAFPALALIVFKQRGVRAIIGTVIYAAIFLAMEAIYGVIALRLWTPETIEAGRQFGSDKFWLMALATFTTIMLQTLAIMFVVRTFRSTVNTDKPYIYIIRPILLIIATIVMFGTSFYRINSLAPGEYFIEVAALILVSSGMLILCVVYSYQDIKLLKIARNNEILVAQQSIYDTLLKETRGFRHNIANQLYGFEGTILTGDIQKIREYYDQMTKQCARINNENIVALNRIPNPGVNALLLNKISATAETGVPMYLLAQEGLKWRGIPDADLCQALGALIDNAIEAAREARVPNVAVEFSNTGDTMEIVVRNTYNADKTDLGFLSAKPRSSKGGHEGLGVSTAREIIARHGRAAINQVLQGRYVVSQILID